MCGDDPSFIFLPSSTSFPLTGCLMGTSHSVCPLRLALPTGVLSSPCLGEWSPRVAVTRNPGRPPHRLLAALSPQPHGASRAALSVLPSLPILGSSFCVPVSSSHLTAALPKLSKRRHGSISVGQTSAIYVLGRIW